MKLKKILICMLSVTFLFVATGCNGNNSESKDNKSNKTQGKSIVATSVAATEILDALDVKVDGVPTTSYTLPDNTKGAKQVGSPMNPDLEIIKSLNPKLVVSVDTLGKDFMDSFTENNIPSEFINLTSLDGLKKSVDKLGKVFNKDQNASNLLNEIENKEKELTQTFKDKKKPRVLTIFGAPGSIMLATSKSYVGNIVSLAGGENILEDDKSLFLPINKEEISKMKPDIILVMTHAEIEKSQQMVKDELAKDPAWKNLSAVKENKIQFLDSKYFGMSANLKVIEAMDIMHKTIYN